MTKLTALSKLANAYHYLFPTEAPQESLNVLSDKFHHIRRSLILDDLRPVPKCTEGFNGRGSTWL
jgi:hypothetical protein